MRATSESPRPGRQDDGGPAGEGEPADPTLPDYGGACLTEVMPTLLRMVDANGAADKPLPSWVPEVVRGASQVVLLVLDGLGWEQLSSNRGQAPSLAAMRGGAITSVAPSTTSTALTSISTGLVPARHGVVGYRVHVGGGDVMNVLRWRTAQGGDARSTIPPREFQPSPAFGGRAVPAVTRANFAGTGFTSAYLAGATLVGWRLPSSMPVEVARLLAGGAPFVFAYYDGVDTVAHEHGFGAHYEAELRAADRIVGDLLAALPAGAALVVTADHGQVEVLGDAIRLDGSILEDVTMMSGEGRFRWLHVKRGSEDRVAERARELYGRIAWVRTRREAIAEGWFGGEPAADVAGRFGDVALAASAPVAFFDPNDTGELRLVCRHGSLTSAEMLVPLLGEAG